MCRTRLYSAGRRARNAMWDRRADQESYLWRTAGVRTAAFRSTGQRRARRGAGRRHLRAI